MNVELHTCFVSGIRHEAHDGKKGENGYGPFAVLTIGKGGTEGNPESALRLFIDATDQGQQFIADLTAALFDVAKALAVKQKAEADYHRRAEDAHADAEAERMYEQHAREAKTEIEKLADHFNTDLGVAAHG